MSFWRPLLLSLCVLATVLYVAEVAALAVGSKPWYGWWDAGFTSSGTPYTIKVGFVDPAGATAAAGMRPGDRIDVRNLPLDDRIAFFPQPFGPRTYTIPVERNGRTFSVLFNASTVFEGNRATKALLLLELLFAAFVALVCGWLIALRGSARREGQLLALALLSIVFVLIPDIVVPVGWIWAVESVISNGFAALQIVAILMLAAHYGRAKSLRNATILVGIALALIALLVSLTVRAGIVWPGIVDPVPFYYGLSSFWLGAVVRLFALIPIAIAVASSPREEKARTAWLLLPIPLGLVIVIVGTLVHQTATSYAIDRAAEVLISTLGMLSYVAVTYAVLGRRVIDIQFVVGRALVFGTISTLVVSAFVLLEWVLGHALEDVSHTAGLAANIALALALGLSMRFIHKFVDKFVDVLFFRKRHDDERALREFAKDAAFLTKSDVLFDRAIAKLREHTDARSAALLVDGDGRYMPSRWFGESEPASASENDEAIVALKSRHKPIDPHHYDSDIAGDLVLPMLVRGRLVGAVVCGPRQRGEAYAPDEVEALSEFAHGVGSAFDSIERSESQNQRVDATAEELRALRASIEVAIATFLRGTP